MKEIIAAIICGVLAIIYLVISIMSFKEKCFLFNNAYIWASKQEREKINKKPYYRQTAVVCALIAFTFLCMAVEIITGMEWLWIVIGAAYILVFVYAVKSSIK